MPAGRRATRFLDSGSRRVTFGLAVLMAAAAAAAWVVMPQHPWRWLRGMLIIPVIWGVVWLYGRWARGGRADRTDEELAAIRRYGDSAVLVFAVTVAIPSLAGYGVAIWTTLGGAASPAPGARRFLGVIAGLTVLWLGNRLPKVLTPLAILPPWATARQQVARRGLGLFLVLAGATMIAAFLLAPVDLAIEVRKWIGGGMLVALVSAIVWMNAGPVAVRERTR